MVQRCWPNPSTWTCQTLEALGENDRSSTGYLPKEVFETMANRFFGLPQENRSLAGSVPSTHRISIVRDRNIHP